MKAYRVLLIDLAKTFGGAEVRVLAQARALQGLVVECAVVTLRDSALHARLQQENLPHHAVRAGRGNPGILLELRRIIRQGGYQVVDAHNVQSVLWGLFAAALAGAPGRVATIHSDYGGEYPGLKGRVYEGVLSASRLVARHYINVTEVLQQKAAAQGYGARSTRIANAVPVPPEPLRQKDTRLYADWGFAPSDFVVGILARLKPVKGHSYLIDAFGQLADLPHAKLLIVGDGPLEAELKAQVAALGLQQRVVFTGFRQDIPDILRALDCMCLASLSEALPYAVLEAASFARPLLVTAVGGLKTLLKHEQTALLVPAQDAAALAGAIRWFVAHPHQAVQIGQNAYHMVRQTFSVETMIASVLQVYDRVVG
ncbi:MAG: glycosyltransferase [Chloroflexi bacterium]|nr:glycosyltransferase [Chloroflexota bacterium]